VTVSQVSDLRLGGKARMTVYDTLMYFFSYPNVARSLKPLYVRNRGNCHKLSFPCVSSRDHAPAPAARRRSKLSFMSIFDKYMSIFEGAHEHLRRIAKMLKNLG
jgi:hypothetical protein